MTAPRHALEAYISLPPEMFSLNASRSRLRGKCNFCPNIDFFFLFLKEKVSEAKFGFNELPINIYIYLPFEMFYQNGRISVLKLTPLKIKFSSNALEETVIEFY